MWLLIAILVILLIGFILVVVKWTGNQETHFKIVNKNLSVEWLEDNCELQQVEKENSFEYQCGEFTVYTWDQIK